MKTADEYWKENFKLPPNKHVMLFAEEYGNYLKEQFKQTSIEQKKVDNAPEIAIVNDIISSLGYVHIKLAQTKMNIKDFNPLSAKISEVKISLYNYVKMLTS